VSLVLMLSAAHPATDVRIVGKEGAALAAFGLRVRHLAPGEVGAAWRDGVELQGFPAARGWRARLLGIPALARLAAAARPAVIHAHEPDSWLAGLLAARRCGARLVLDVHEHYPSRLDARLPAPLRPPARLALRLFCRLLASQADAVVVAKDGLEGDFGGAARCTPVRNYATPAALAPRLHAPGPVTLLHLGALGASRGALLMPELLALLPEARLRLVGRFTDSSHPAFMAAAERLGVAGRIAQTGWMDREAALAAAAECDIGLVLFQPRVENHRLALPHKLFDCMLAGLPVIVPDFAEEVAAVVREAGCGVVTDVADAAALAAAVRSLSSPARRADMGRRGREAALHRFAWAPEAARLVRLYGRLLAAPARRSAVLQAGAERRG
jgi:glycosyltransferase involved in cell wall biosynthesis